MRDSLGGRIRPLIRRFLPWAALPFILYYLVLAHGLHPTRHGPYINVASYYDGFTLGMIKQGSLFSPVFPQMGFPAGVRQNFGYPAEVFAAFLVATSGMDPITAHQLFGCLSLITGYLSLSLLCYFYSKHLILSLFGPIFFYSSLQLFYFHSFFQLAYSFSLIPAYVLANGVLARHCVLDVGRWDRSLLLAVPVFLLNLFAVFLDAYSAFFVFAASAVAVVPYLIHSLRRKQSPAPPIYQLLPFGIALLGPFLLFAVSYQSGAARPEPPLDFLRGQGVDLVTLVTPTHEI
jgi:hypothetical protein